MFYAVGDETQVFVDERRARSGALLRVELNADHVARTHGGGKTVAFVRRPGGDDRTRRAAGRRNCSRSMQSRAARGANIGSVSVVDAVPADLRRPWRAKPGHRVPRRRRAPHRRPRRSRRTELHAEADPEARKPRARSLSRMPSRPLSSARAAGSNAPTPGSTRTSVSACGTRVGLEAHVTPLAAQCLRERVQVARAVVEERDAHQHASRSAASTRSITGHGAAVIRNASPMPGRPGTDGPRFRARAAHCAIANALAVWARAGSSRPTAAARSPSRAARRRGGRGSRRRPSHARGDPLGVGRERLDRGAFGHGMFSLNGPRDFSMISTIFAEAAP